MGINIADNFAYNGKKPLDNRTEYTTLSAMKAVVDANINEGCLAYNKEDGKYYKFLSTNTVDASTGKWREFSAGGGGQTYNDFTGATASTAGAHGLVPAPSAGDEGKVLFGNGLWGALPSVDYSVLSNEAFIFSTTEKVVGQWTDGKLLYQKTYEFSTSISVGTNWFTTTIPTTDMDFLLGVVNSYSGDDSSWQCLNSAKDSKGVLLQSTRTSANVTVKGVTLRYTKTTDSPLPSDVKFAGVTDTGDIIYKKWVTTGGAVPSGGTLLYRQALLNGKDILYYTLAS